MRGGENMNQNSGKNLEKPVMSIEINVNVNNEVKPVEKTNEIIAKMNKEHSTNYALMYRITFNF